MLGFKAHVRFIDAPPQKKARKHMKATRFYCIALLSLFTWATTNTTDAASLPTPPPGKVWVSQGIFTHTDSASDSVSFNFSDDVDVATNPTTELLNETLSLTTFDATGDATNHFCIVSSTVLTTLGGGGSAILLNIAGNELPANQDFEGLVSLSGWQISGAASSAPFSDSLVRTGAAQRMTVGPNSAAPFTDFASGDANATLNFTASGANSIHDGSSIDVDFDGQFVVDILSPTASTQPALATGSANFNATLNTVYEHFVLVDVPEPGAAALLTLAAPLLLLTRRRRRA